MRKDKIENEKHQIICGKIILRELPKRPESEIPYKETVILDSAYHKSSKNMIDDFGYYIDYDIGEITFNKSQEGKEITIKEYKPKYYYSHEFLSALDI